MPVTLRALCEDWVVGAPAWREIASRGGGITTSRVARLLLCPLVMSQWRDCPGVLCPSQPHEEAKARSLMEADTGLVLRQLKNIRTVVEEAVTVATEMDCRPLGLR